MRLNLYLWMYGYKKQVFVLISAALAVLALDKPDSLVLCQII